MPTSVIQQLHESEINGEVSWLFDGTFRARVGETEATLKSCHIYSGTEATDRDSD